MTAKEAKHESHVRMEYIRHGTGGLETKMTWGQNGGGRMGYGWRSSVEDMNR